MSSNGDLRQVMGAGIAAKRRERGYSQPVFCALAGVQQKHLSRWENGHVRPEQATLDRFAEVLECDWTDFLDAGRIELQRRAAENVA